MSRRNETNAERLVRHRIDLERCLENRKKLNERIARLEERITQDENQEYVAIIHSESITLEDLRRMIHDPKPQGTNKVPAHMAQMNMKEIQDNEEHNADERQKRVQDRLDKIRETILNADLKEIKHGKARKEKAQKEMLVKLFDLMRKTGGDREETIIRLSKGYKLKKSSAKRFYDRGLALIKVLLDP